VLETGAADGLCLSVLELPKPFCRRRLVNGEPYALPEGKMTQQALDREHRILENKLHELG